MAGRLVRAIGAAFATMALALALLAGASPALAATSAELSDDGLDYGWLYRRADVLYGISDDTPQLWKRDGAWYLTERHRDICNVGACSSLYADGTLYIHSGVETDGAPVCLEAAVRSGSVVPKVMAFNNWFCAGNDAYPRLPFLRDVDAVTGLRYQPTDVSRVVVAADACGHWCNGDSPACMDRLFEGCAELTGAEGLENLPSDAATTMARMFAGCERLEELDLTGFDTAACEDFSGMFDGCVSLAVLRLGTGWTQETARTEAGDEALATFPVPMRRQEGGAAFRKGDAIPDGPGTYEVDYAIADRIPLNQATVTLGEGAGAREVAGQETFTVRYTGEELRPSVTVTVDGTLLSEGEDYEVVFRNNVEVTGPDGHATVVVEGKDAYCGSVMTSFAIEDVSTYAFLYEGGLLYLKAGHDLPPSEAVSRDRAPIASWRWYDFDDADAGSQVPWAAEAASVRRVVIDASFARLAPRTMAGWFAGCAGLASVEGLGNVDTTRVTSMACLFEGCSALAELDLSGLRTSGVADLAALLRDCSSLERLVLGDLDLAQAASTHGFLAGCGRLKELTLGSAWANAEEPSARLAFPREAFRTSPGYVRMAAGAEVPAGAGTYRLRDLALQFCTVEMDKDTYTCTGSPIRPPLTVRLGGVVLRQGSDYTVTYANNVYPSNVAPKATILGKGIFSGGLVVPFKIVARVTKVGDRLVIKNKSGTFVVKVTKVSKSGRAAEVMLLSVQALPGVKSLTLPSECTLGGVKVSLTSVSSKLTGDFKNVSSVIVGAKVTTIGKKAFSKASKVKTLIIKSARLKTVKGCLTGSKISSVKTKVSLSSSKKKSYKSWFTSKSVVGRKVSYSYG